MQGKCEIRVVFIDTLFVIRGPDRKEKLRCGVAIYTPPLCSCYFLGWRAAIAKVCRFLRVGSCAKGTMSGDGCDRPQGCAWMGGVA